MICSVLIPSAGIIRIRFFGSMQVITVYYQAHLLSLGPQAPRDYLIVKVELV